MMADLAGNLILQLVLFEGVALGVMLSNLRRLHAARKHAPPQDYPLVSVLVPARNEEENIGRCVQSLLGQDYPAFEVLVLDDQSSDGTPAILARLAEGQPRLTLLAGKAGPAGLSGKNWACSQLAEQARGELLFFTNADTVHQPDTLRAIVTALSGERADLVSGFPRQQVVTWGERLLVPFFSWACLCFLPLGLAYRLRLPALSVAVGQMMCFRREAYRAVGGHAGVGMSIVDDVVLARKIQAAGLRWRVVSISDLVTTRMYRGGREAAKGFSNSMFAAFDYRLLTYAFAYLWLVVLFWAPWVALAVAVLGKVPATQIGQPLAAIALALPLWIWPYREIGVPAYLALLYPLTALANVALAFRSLIFNLTGRAAWKERSLARPKWKWL